MSLLQFNSFEMVNALAFVLGMIATVIATAYARQVRLSGNGRLPKSFALFLGQIVSSFVLLFMLQFGEKEHMSITTLEFVAFMLFTHTGCFLVIALMNQPRKSVYHAAGGGLLLLVSILAALHLEYNAYSRSFENINFALLIPGSVVLTVAGTVLWQFMSAARRASAYAMLAASMSVTLILSQLLALTSVSHEFNSAILPVETSGLGATRLQFILMFNMAAAVCLSCVVGNNPRHHWRRYTVSAVLIVVFSVLVFQATDRALKESSRYFELAQLVEKTKNNRFELRQLVIDFQSENYIDTSQLALSSEVFSKISAYNDMIIDLNQFMSDSKVSEEIRAYYFAPDIDGGKSLHQNLSDYSNAAKGALGLQPGYSAYTNADNLRLERQLSHISTLIHNKTFATRNLQVLVRDMSFVGGLFIVMFIGFGVFVPAHLSTIAALNALEQEKDRIEKLALCAEHTSKGIVVAGMDAKIVWCNDAFLEITGFKLSELVGYGVIRKLRHPDADMEQISKLLQDLSEKRAGEIEVIARKKDGSDLWLKIAISPVEQNGVVTQYVHVVEDITEARQIEDRLGEARLENERLALIARHATDGMILLGPDFELLWMNEAMQKQTGYSFEQMRNGDLKSLLNGPFTDSRTVSNILNEVRQHRPVSEEMLVYPKSGSPYWIEAIHNPLFESDGTFSGFVIVHRDITERKNLELELISHRDELAARVEERTQTIRNQSLELEKALDRERELNRLQTEFVSMASHEFRTPLTIIDGVARRLERRADRIEPDDIRERAGSIRSTVKRMTMLVERTLDATRLSSGRIKLTPEEFGLKDLLREIIARQREVAHGHKIETDIEQIPDRIFGDARLLDNVFTNVLSNAVKYSGESRRVKVIGKVDDTYATIRVKDFGIGIPKDELGKIFQRFFRASTSAGIPGTGIGLNLVKSLVEMHYGVVNIESEEGQWTEFTVSLPLNSPLIIAEQTNEPSDDFSADAQVMEG